MLFRSLAVSVSDGNPVRIGTPRKLFQFYGTVYAPAKDGQRVLAAVPLVAHPFPVLPSVLTNWTSLLTK